MSTAPAASPVALPDREAILARATDSLDLWRARLPAAGRPRLFFTPESWAGLRGRYAASTGRERANFDAALAAARQLAASPVPAYRSPEEWMRDEPDPKPFETLQELWVRPVADGVVVLAFALALEEDAVVLARLRETVLAMCAWPQWGTLADLASGHAARAVAIACDWHPAIWSDEEKTIIRGVIRTRMEAMKTAAYGELYWAGHYDENHNQVGVCALGLCGLAFLDEIPEAAEWTALALDNFACVARDCHADGTSVEGVPYWSYGMSFVLQYLEGTRHVLGTGALYDSPTFQNSIAARAHASTPDLAGTVAWGDAVPRDYYGPHHLLFRLAAEYRDPAGQFLGEALPFGPGGGPDVWVWTALWHDPTLAARAPDAPDHHAPVGALVTTRSGWNANDYLLAFKAGYTNRNHSHLDAGALSLCVGDEWLLTTPGYGLGKGDAEFWDKAGGRWNYQSNATEGQSTLLVNGRNQRFDFDARGVIDAFASDAHWCWTSADLTGAYEGVTAVRRSVLHRRGAYVLVLDAVQTPEPATVEWLAQVPPVAELREGGLFVPGRLGSLEIRPFGPSPVAFAPRAPTSPRLDVPAERMKTCALVRRGATTARFAVALVPRLDPSPPAALRFSHAETAAGVQEFRIEGDGWRDLVTVSESPGQPPRLVAHRPLGDRVEPGFSSP